MKRRNFLKNSFALIAPTMVSGNPVYVLADHPIINPSILSTIQSDRVLVIIQLSGGNDGLNTVIPVSIYEKYYKARTNIAIPENRILKLNNYTEAGLNPAMTSLQNLYNEGKLNIVNAVGYPKPNFSHFRATDIWMTGADSDAYLNTGWAGRYLNYLNPNYPDGYPNEENPDPLAIQIGSLTSITCQGPTVNMGLSISDPNAFYNLLEGTEEAVPDSNAGYELTFLRRIAKQTNKYGMRIKAASDKVTKQVTYPNNSLAAQLKIVAKLIKGGLQTKVYMVSFGGFDTHANQVNTIDKTIGTHANLLTTLSSAIGAFQSDLQAMEIEDRVIGMTYSEFGRRIKSNASGGTDHGAAAPLFLFGKNVRGGVYGVNPDLPMNATTADNIPYQFDFRTIYNSILQNWFCIPAESELEIMLNKFPTIPIINASACGIAKANSIFSSDTVIFNYPNPFSNQTKIEFKIIAGHTLLQLLNASGIVIKVLIDATYTNTGMNSYTLFMGGQPAGIYYIRLQNGINQYVKTIVKL